MAQGPEDIERPHFVIEESADDAVGTRLRMLERRISESPDLFRLALSNLGELATKDTIAFSERDERNVTLRRGAADMITEFFHERYDLEMSFDAKTEADLLEDETHRSLLEDARSKRMEHVKTGIMKSTSRPNEQAVPARERLRRYRLEFYIGQVLSYQQPGKSLSTSKKGTSLKQVG